MALTQKLFVIEVSKTLVENNPTINCTFKPKGYKLIKVLSSFNLQDDYQTLIKNASELEQYKNSFPNHPLDIYDDNYFKDYSLIVIHTTWRNTSNEFKISEIRIDNQTLDVSLSYDPNRVAGYAMTQVVFIIEVEQSLVDDVDTINYHFQALKIDDSLDLIKTKSITKVMLFQFTLFAF